MLRKILHNMHEETPKNSRIFLSLEVPEPTRNRTRQLQQWIAEYPHVYRYRYDGVWVAANFKEFHDILRYIFTFAICCRSYCVLILKIMFTDFDSIQSIPFNRYDQIRGLTSPYVHLYCIF